MIVQGKDVLIKVGGKATGHSTTCSINLTASTKERNFKRPEDEVMAPADLFNEKNVDKLSAQITSEGLACFDEKESGYQALAAAYMKAEPVEVEAIVRKSAGAAKDAFLSGKFIITSLTLTGPEDGDGTYSITLENSGRFEFTPAEFIDVKE